VRSTFNHISEKITRQARSMRVSRAPDWTFAHSWFFEHSGSSTTLGVGVGGVGGAHPDNLR